MVLTRIKSIFILKQSDNTKLAILEINWIYE